MCRKLLKRLVPAMLCLCILLASAPVALATELAIIVQPKDSYAAIGGTVSFSVTAQFSSLPQSKPS